MTNPRNNLSAEFKAEDHRFMARALQLAQRGLCTTMPNPRVGCVIVKDGEIIGEGWHERIGEAHAEVNALKAAGDKTKDAKLYVTLEPCCHSGRTRPCTDAVIAAGIKRVVSAMTDPNPKVAGQGLALLESNNIKVANGCCADDAQALNPGFVKRMQTGLPWVRVKSAMSLDGKTAMASGESKWITGKAARADVAQWRARSCAVMTGINTVLADDPGLTARIDGLERQPLRVVLDSQLRIPENAKLFDRPGEILIVTTINDISQHKKFSNSNAEILVVEEKNGKIALSDLLLELGRRKINEVLVESGALLAGAFAQQRLVDEYVVYLAPRLLGDDGRGMLNLPQITQLSETINLEISSVRQIGDDLLIVARPKIT
ncbi:MAG: bifunctional diaminohydroxyphosphoribosylaminopyrimidine deaminase/5-amino-6-(5-phosphoribosylamino)uracil reductase RibD [Gammaproteobacteria bacterium]|nr:bifunctional diaminohydroxyphosphoribosylaminopyrimidine deaminase/5-amino-6-(5-phosphoribosylamino)uracil reductase RibD [Gammaproteobacteria bacterium]